MSNIYIQEPPTSGKVLLKTTVGDIDVELWAREAPKACRNFVQLCLEGYYDGTVFHRLVKGFIVQGGDPTGTGAGGDSCYGEPFKDEFHSRLRFVRRGLLAMANAGKDDNGSQFFFTLGPAPELQNKHTIFGKVVGDTLYNMLRLEDGLVDQEERPVYPQKVLHTEVLSNPFTDIEPRVRPESGQPADGQEPKRKKKRAAVKNFSLLSFGDEAEDDEEENAAAARQLASRAPAGGKSAHELLQDPKLSAAPAVDADAERLSGDEEGAAGEWTETPALLEASAVRTKLQGSGAEQHLPGAGGGSSEAGGKGRKRQRDGDKDAENSKKKATDKEEEEEAEKETEIVRLRREYRQLRAQLRAEKQRKEKTAPSEEGAAGPEAEAEAAAVAEFRDQQKHYRALRDQQPRKGAGRENFTLQMLARFQEKLASAKEQQQPAEDQAKETGADAVTDAGADDDDDEGWLTHKLEFDKSAAAVLAKDASSKEDDWFEIYDPRNPINKRRREAGAASGSGRDRRARGAGGQSRGGGQQRR